MLLIKNITLYNMKVLSLLSSQYSIQVLSLNLIRDSQLQLTKWPKFTNDSTQSLYSILHSTLRNGHNRFCYSHIFLSRYVDLLIKILISLYQLIRSSFDLVTPFPPSIVDSPTLISYASFSIVKNKYGKIHILVFVTTM